MKKSLLLLAVLIVCFSAAIPLSAHAQVTELWNRTYDGGYNDWAKGVATDGSGNVIVTGESDSNYYTIKYDSDGTELWNRTYDGGYNDWAKGVATDGSGNVIVTGESDSNYYTIKYDPNGTELWNRTYDSGLADKGSGVATDASGNVIVTGESDSNYYTIKYDSAGTEIWNRTYDGGLADTARGVATDVSGNMIVTGGSSGNYYTIKYDPNGTELWNRTYDSDWVADEAYGVATDGSGNVIVTGFYWIPEFDTAYYYTIKYDPDGTELWNQTLSAGPWSFADDVATDASGNVIVTGDSYGAFTMEDYLTIAYDSDGTELWKRTYDGGFGDIAEGVATDVSGNVIVTGGSYDGSSNNYYTIKYATLETDTVGYSATVTGGQNTFIQSSDGAFGSVPRGGSATISPSVVLNNTGDAAATVEARFADDIGGLFGLISGTNVLAASNFEMGPTGGSLVALSDSGADVEVATAPGGITTDLDAKLSVPSDQPPGDYAGTVILMFSNM
jgi:predicted Rdx family selenoprotein